MVEQSGVSLFCSYSHQDSDFLVELSRYLQLLEQSGIIRVWHDGRIHAGDDWRQRIDERLQSSDIVLLLVSVHFLTSEFIMRHELPVALDRHRRDLALVVPILLRPVPHWQQSELARFQALPQGAKPVALWDSRDAAYTDICERLSAAILERTQKELERAAPRPRASQVHRRVLDVGLGSEVPAGRSTIVAVMIRRSSSGGLRAIFQRNGQYRIQPEEVESSESFPVHFPERSGVLGSASLVVEIESGDFTCSTPRKALEAAPNADSAVCVFMVQAVRKGALTLVVNVYADGNYLCGLPVHSVGVEEASPAPKVESASFAADPAPPAPGPRPVPKATAPRMGTWALALVTVAGLTFGGFLLQRMSRPEAPPTASGPPQLPMDLTLEGRCSLTVRTELLGRMHFLEIVPPGPVSLRNQDEAILTCATRQANDAGPFDAMVEWRRDGRVVESVRSKVPNNYGLVWRGRLTPGDYQVEVAMQDQRTGSKFRWAESYRVVSRQAATIGK